MTAAGELLAGEISRGGPIPFRRFMEVALYHPQHGYYQRAHDPFGKEGDFFTSEQIQPAFGILMAARIRQLFRNMGEPEDFTVVELGAGRGEMANALQEWRYLPVDVDSNSLPEPFEGVVFSNEFFDALPVDVATYRSGAFREALVGFENGRFLWALGDSVREEVEDYLRRYFPPPAEGQWYEASLQGLDWIERIGRALENGYALTIDYGFTRSEAIRFPHGTLMGYRRHTAREDVLENPGERDITAHVNFTALMEYGSECALRADRFETLAQTLLSTGETDQFAAVLSAEVPAEELRRRMQLKTLLFGMGETFRTLLQHREGRKRIGGKRLKQ
ncbi:MAG TPA: SAM-dependent methyltransferase [Bryobacteraceae bacterium]|nr:SAM-dependent methyltransferase [Bryobacteraceae bacterium]